MINYNWIVDDLKPSYSIERPLAHSSYESIEASCSAIHQYWNFTKTSLHKMKLEELID